MIEIQLTIHGRQCGFNDVSPHTRLLDFLRERGLTRAKEGCAEGECGACAVLVARPDGTDRTRWTSINACLPPAWRSTARRSSRPRGWAPLQAPAVAVNCTRCSRR